MAKLAQFGYHVNEKRFLTGINSTKEAWKSYQWWSRAFFHREQPWGTKVAYMCAKTERETKRGVSYARADI